MCYEFIINIDYLPELPAMSLLCRKIWPSIFRICYAPVSLDESLTRDLFLGGGCRVPIDLDYLGLKFLTISLLKARNSETPSPIQLPWNRNFLGPGLVAFLSSGRCKSSFLGPFN